MIFTSDSTVLSEKEDLLRIPNEKFARPVRPERESNIKLSSSTGVSTAGGESARGADVQRRLPARCRRRHGVWQVCLPVREGQQAAGRGPAPLLPQTLHPLVVYVCRGECRCVILLKKKREGFDFRGFSSLKIFCGEFQSPLPISPAASLVQPRARCSLISRKTLILEPHILEVSFRRILS